MTTSLAQLEATANDLTTAVRSLISQCRDAAAATGEVASGIAPQPLVPPTAPIEVHQTRRRIMGSITKLQTMLNEPFDLLLQLSMQNQLLACLQWLCEFQVLPFIPLTGSVAISSVANLASIPETQLSRVIRMMATSGFLNEPQTGQVAHTALSAPFVTKPTSRDAVLFIAQTGAPAALHMPVATRRFGQSQRPNEAAYNVAFDAQATFRSTCDQQSKLQRQWHAYLRHTITEDNVFGTTDFLSSFDWSSLGNSVVVDVGARTPTTAIALAELHPALQFIVQANEDIGPRTIQSALKTGMKFSKIPRQFKTRITMDSRSVGAPQTVEGAAAYIIRVPWPPTPSTLSLPAYVTAELRAHIGVLRANPSARLLVTACLVPEPGTVDPVVESVARLRDLTLLQLSNEHELDALELVNLLSSIEDSGGRLVLVNKVRSRNNAAAVFEMKFKPHELWSATVAPNMLL